MDKTKVTCIKWLSSPKTYFIASYTSGYLYVFDEQLNYQRDTNIQPTYSTIKDDEKNFSISYTKVCLLNFYKLIVFKNLIIFRIKLNKHVIPFHVGRLVVEVSMSFHFHPIIFS